MKPLFTEQSQAIFYNQHPLPIQRMLDFDWLCRRKTPSVAAIVNPTKAGTQLVFWGSEAIMLPVFTTIEEAASNYPKADILVNFASMRSAFQTSLEALETSSIRTVAVTAEGVPENETRELIRVAEANDKWLIGPATVGGIKPGAFRIANTGGAIDNLVDSRLYRPGSVSVVTVSGGMSNEIYSIASLYADGVYEGIAVGGDHFPGTTLLQNILRLDKEDGCKMHILLGEIGGTAEYEVANAIKSGQIKKPVVAWVTGTVAELFATEVQFGHANAKSGVSRESAQAKNRALRKAGAFVPKSFNELGKAVHSVFEKQVASRKNYFKPNDENYTIPPIDYVEAVKQNLVRKEPTIISSISDDRGEEPTYNKQEISLFADKSIGYLVNALWFKGELNTIGEEFIELVVKLSADHGPAVATAHNAIVTARAGKDVIDSLVAGLLTIGPRHGGAVDDAARWVLSGLERGLSAREFVTEMKQKGELIMGIGHRIKTAQNPDKRVELLKQFAKNKLDKTPHLDFALLVEQETLKKKNNLILNVDGTIAAVFVDILSESGFSKAQITEIVDAGALNGIFALGRTIGIIGHTLDQKRLQQGLYRHPWDDILYL